MKDADFRHNNNRYFVVLGVYGPKGSNNDTVVDLLLYILLQGSQNNLHDDPLMTTVFTLIDIVIVQIICWLCCNFWRPQ